VYDRVSHLETAHDVWLKLCTTYEGPSEIKSSCRGTHNRQYQSFSLKPSESLDDCFARFESIVLAVLLLILIMNVLNNCCMLLMILCGV
jgi:hypothetical protein